MASLLTTDQQQYDLSFVISTRSQQLADKGNESQILQVGKGNECPVSRQPLSSPTASPFLARKFGDGVPIPSNYGGTADDCDGGAYGIELADGDGDVDDMELADGWGFWQLFKVFEHVAGEDDKHDLFTVDVDNKGSGHTGSDICKSGTGRKQMRLENAQETIAKRAKKTNDSLNRLLVEAQVNELVNQEQTQVIVNAAHLQSVFMEKSTLIQLHTHNTYRLKKLLELYGCKVKMAEAGQDEAKADSWRAKHAETELDMIEHLSREPLSEYVEKQMETLADIRNRAARSVALGVFYYS